MYTINNISIQFSGNWLFEEVSFLINHRDRIGLVGKNGAVLTDGLFINEAADVDLYGALTLTGAFDADQAGFNWKDGGALTVKGALALTNALDGADKTLALDGSAASWSRAGDIQVVGSNTAFKILNGATADSTNRAQRKAKVLIASVLVGLLVWCDE